MGSLQGKVVIVTGAGRGIGLAVAQQLAREGARLVLNDVGCDPEGEGADRSVVEQAVAAVRAAGGEAIGDAGDLCDAETPARLVGRAREELGRLDAVVGSAGIRRNRSLRKMTDGDVGHVLDVHVKATFRLVGAAVESLVDQGDGGSITLMTGPLAFFGGARQSLEAAGVAAVAGLVRSSAVELRRHRIRVNGIAPTARTRLTEDLPLFRGVSESSMGPDHVAPVVTYLTSDTAHDVSGEILGVAGGRIYAIRSRETTGAFMEGRPFTPEEVGTAFEEITRTG